MLSVLKCSRVVSVESGESGSFCSIDISCLAEADMTVLFGERHKLDIFVLNDCASLDEFVLSVDGLDDAAIFAGLYICHQHLRVVNCSELISLSINVKLSVKDLFQLLELVLLLLIGELIMLMKVFFEKLVMLFGN